MTRYADRIARTLAHIEAHLACDLTLDRLAGVAALSRFHFSRMFRAMRGEGVAEAVRRIRMNRAAVLLVVTRLPVPQIAARVGYANPQSFERAFRDVYARTARAVRDGGRIPPPALPPTQGDLPMYPVEIRDEPRVRAAALPHTGAYPKIGETFGALVERLQAAGVWDGSGPSIALYYDDPSEVPTEALRAHAGQVLPDGVAVPEGLDPIDLGGGRHAVLTYTGAYDGLPEAWAYFYSQWMPASGHSFGAAVPFERYLTNAWETPPAQNVTEICVPLAD